MLIELVAALALVVVCALLHAGGLMLTSRLFHLEDEELKQRPFDAKATWLIIIIAMAIFFIHALEIWLFAIFYAAVGTGGGFENALYISASTYTTAGDGIEMLSHDWRLVGAAEALAGFLLLGWSTAYLVQKLTKLRE
jgi:hypothetical protein